MTSYQCENCAAKKYVGFPFGLPQRRTFSIRSFKYTEHTCKMDQLNGKNGCFINCELLINI